MKNPFVIGWQPFFDPFSNITRVTTLIPISSCSHTALPQNFTRSLFRMIPMTTRITTVTKFSQSLHRGQFAVSD